MTHAGTKPVKERKRSCYAVALARARGARRRGLNPVLVALVFVWAFLSGPFSRGPFAVLPRRPIPRAHEAEQAARDGWPITDFERGLSGPFKRRSDRVARYQARPSLARLMADLRRSAARADATAALIARIADPAVRAWAAERIAKEEFNRLAIYVRPGRSEETVLAAWRGEANADLAQKASSGKAIEGAPERADMLRVAKLLETLAGTDTVTSGGPKGPAVV